MMINAQFRILFMLPYISTESAEGLKALQNSLNNSMSALQLQNVDVSKSD